MKVDYMIRNWGRWYVLDDLTTTKVKKLIVDPGCQLSYQKHLHRNEIWYVHQGGGVVILSDGEFEIQKILEKGFKLGFERKDPYVNDLYKFMRKGHSKEIALIDRLLFGAMIEARSCERFKLLSEKLKDHELREFYRELMISEANHYTTFLAFARRYGEGIEDVNQRWQQWIDYESEIILSYGKQETIHG